MKLLLLLSLTWLVPTITEVVSARPFSALWQQELTASNPPLPTGEGVFFLQDAKYLELTCQTGKGVDIGRLVQKRMAKFRATATLPDKPVKFAVNEARLTLLLHLPKFDPEQFKLLRLAGGEAAGQVLFVISGYPGLVPVLSTQLTRKAIAYQTEKRGDAYLLLQPKAALAPGVYALVETDPAEPRVWAFSVKRR